MDWVLAVLQLAKQLYKKVSAFFSITLPQKVWREFSGLKCMIWIEKNIHTPNTYIYRSVSSHTPETYKYRSLTYGRIHRHFSNLFLFVHGCLYKPSDIILTFCTKNDEHTTGTFKHYSLKSWKAFIVANGSVFEYKALKNIIENFTNLCRET